MQESIAKGNNLKYILINILQSTALLVATGTVVQTFLLAFGVSEDSVSVYSSIVQIVQVVAMLVCLFVGDSVKNIKGLISVLFLVFPVILIAMLVVLIGRTGGENVVYTIVLIGSIITNLALGVYNVLCYKLPYFVIDTKDYGRISSVAGIFSGGVGIGGSALLSLFVKNYDYRIVMTVAFLVGAVLWLISAVLCHSYKIREIPEELQGNAHEEKGLKTVLRVLKHPVFYKTVVPHILRGVGLGVLSLIVVIGKTDGILNTKTSTYVTIFTNLAVIAGDGLYLAFDRFMGVKKSLFVSGIVLLLILPFTAAFENLIAFYIFYFVGYTFLTVVNMCVPVLVYDCVEYEIMSKYTAIRMLLFTLGQALPGFIFSRMVATVGTFGVLVLAGASFCISSVWFCLVLKKQTKKSDEAVGETEKKTEEIFEKKSEN